LWRLDGAAFVRLAGLVLSASSPRMKPRVRDKVSPPLSRMMQNNPPPRARANVQNDRVSLMTHRKAMHLTAPAIRPIQQNLTMSAFFQPYWVTLEPSSRLCTKLWRNKHILGSCECTVGSVMWGSVWCRGVYDMMT